MIGRIYTGKLTKKDLRLNSNIVYSRVGSLYMKTCCTGGWELPRGKGIKKKVEPFRLIL
jgi:hypothetical protein